MFLYLSNSKVKMGDPDVSLHSDTLRILLKDLRTFVIKALGASITFVFPLSKNLP